MTSRGLPVGLVTILCLGFAFLYLPMALLILWSFNASRLATVWTGFSTRWYWALLQDEALLASARVSLEVAIASAALATPIGAAAGYVLARFGHFRTRALFSGLVYAPLALPEIVAGLSLLLLFVALDIDRGMVTIIIAHATLGTGYVAVVVLARLRGLDRHLEEAALDLGASPAVAFRTITLPLIAPALASGFLLAFTLSLDDVVLASFTSGPGATTLPLRIYSAVRLGISPEINAISTLLLAGVGFALLCVAALGGLGRPIDQDRVTT